MQEQSSPPSAKPEIALYYSLARTGGTLIARSLGAIPGNALLSEVSPRMAYFDPIRQADEWYGLITPEERAWLKTGKTIRYAQAIALIGERCRAQGLRLIVRDWTHIDFLKVDRFAVQPRYEFSQISALGELFDIRHKALVRHPLDSYLSLIKLRGYRNVTVSDYLYGFRRFAERAVESGFVRYEDFCLDPKPVLAGLCRDLRLKYQDDFVERFGSYRNVTGDIYSASEKFTLAGALVQERCPDRIVPLPRRTPPPGLLERMQDNAGYRGILDLLGYS